MSLYHCSAKIVGRSGGKSAVGSIAYDMRIKAIDEETGKVLDYRKKGKVDPCLMSKRLLPNDCPEQFKVNGDWARLWNEVQRKENRKNSQFARDFNIALQKELTIEQNFEVLKKWVFRNFKDVIADVAIHAPHKYKDGTTNDNIHAHVMLTTRRIDRNSPDGWGEKDRDSNSKDFLNQARKSLADLFNEKFKELGINEHIDHRTLEEQGIDREPQQHMGPIATAIERSGRIPDRKRYATEVTSEEKTTIVTQEELNKALSKNIEWLQLLELEKKEKAKTQEQNILEMAKKRSLAYQNNGVSPHKAIHTEEVLQMYFYVHENAESEIEYWNSMKSKDVKDREYNKGLDERIQDVKVIKQTSKPTLDILPRVDRYYENVKLRAAHHQKDNTHFSKLKNWIDTTNFLPVKICRATISLIQGELKNSHKRVIERDQNHGYSR